MFLLLWFSYYFVVNNKEKLTDAELWVYRGEDDFTGEYKDLLELIKKIPYIKFNHHTRNIINQIT
jgi:hypothetical protein